MQIQKVLVVDDSKTELMFMTDLLQKRGMQVRTDAGALAPNAVAMHHVSWAMHAASDAARQPAVS